MNNNICISGCGIVTSAMVINYWGFRDLDPVELGDWMLEEGFRDDLSNTSGATCNGVSHEAMCSAAKFYGMKCQESTDFKVQWEPLNGIADNGINWLLESNLPRFTSPKLLFQT